MVVVVVVLCHDLHHEADTSQDTHTMLVEVVVHAKKQNVAPNKEITRPISAQRISQKVRAAKKHEQIPSNNAYCTTSRQSETWRILRSAKK